MNKQQMGRFGKSEAFDVTEIIHGLCERPSPSMWLLRSRPAGGTWVCSESMPSLGRALFSSLKPQATWATCLGLAPRRSDSIVSCGKSLTNAARLEVV
jgi:hypothetical protein